MTRPSLYRGADARETDGSVVMRYQLNRLCSLSRHCPPQTMTDETTRWLATGCVRLKWRKWVSILRSRGNAILAHSLRPVSNIGARPSPHRVFEKVSPNFVFHSFVHARRLAFSWFSKSLCQTYDMHGFTPSPLQFMIVVSFTIP